MPLSPAEEKPLTKDSSPVNGGLTLVISVGNPGTACWFIKLAGGGGVEGDGDSRCAIRHPVRPLAFINISL